jgi:hypothetical protein
MTTPWADGFQKLNPGRIEQLNDVPGETMKFFGEPMVGITVKQFDEYMALRARAAEKCLWTRDPNPDDVIYHSDCDDVFRWTGENVSDEKFCHNCGRKVDISPEKEME